MERLRKKGYQWISTCRADEIDVAKVTAESKVNAVSPTCYEFKPWHAIVIPGATAGYWVRRLIYDLRHWRSQDFSEEASNVVIFIVIAFVVGYIFFYLYLRRRARSYAVERLEKNQGREILVGKDAFYISVGELLRSDTLSSEDEELKVQMLDVCRKTQADYLCFEYADCQSFLLEYTILDIFPRDPRQDKFSLRLFETNFNMSSDQFVEILSKKLPVGKGILKNKLSRENILGYSFAAFMLLGIMWSAYITIWPR